MVKPAYGHLNAWNTKTGDLPLPLVSMTIARTDQSPNVAHHAIVVLMNLTGLYVTQYIFEVATVLPAPKDVTFGWVSGWRKSIMDLGAFRRHASLMRYVRGWMVMIKDVNVDLYRCCLVIHMIVKAARSMAVRRAERHYPILPDASGAIYNVGIQSSGRLKRQTSSL